MKLAFLIGILTFFFLPFLHPHAIAQNKVVVIPLFEEATGPPAPVEKTGQTVLYATGDDGDLEKGVAWPNPRFTDNEDGTVTDNLTGLIWLKNANCPGTKPWSSALAWANGLYDGCPDCGGTDNDCGLSDGSVAGDWRLPNVRELQSLIHYGLYDPAVPNTTGTGKWTSGDPFTNVQLLHYWSSTTDASDTSYAWSVYFGTGTVIGSALSLFFYVWPVRGGN